MQADYFLCGFSVYDLVKSIRRLENAPVLLFLSEWSPVFVTYVTNKITKNSLC